MPDWKTVVAAVAPTIATALGGPLAGVAVNALGRALTGKDDCTEADVAAAVAAARPELLLQLKTAEIDLQKRLAELEIDLERVHSADRGSARDREAKTGDSFTPRLLAILVTIGFFGCLGYLLIAGKPALGGDALLVMLGALGGAWTAIISYYFGSSASSASKTALLAKR